MIKSALVYLALATAVAFSIAVYLLPVLIGWLRHVRDLGSLAVINVLLGWTLLGWVAALALALRSTPRAAAAEGFQGFPPAAPPPGGIWTGPPGPPPLRLPPRPAPDLPPHPGEAADTPAGDAGEERP